MTTIARWEPFKRSSLHFIIKSIVSSMKPCFEGRARNQRYQYGRQQWISMRDAQRTGGES